MGIIGASTFFKHNLLEIVQPSSMEKKQSSGVLCKIKALFMTQNKAY